MPKIMKFNEKALQSIAAGVKILAEAVSVTLGPGGRNVVIEKESGGPPSSTRDGTSVAKEVFLEDPFENMGAQLVKEAASKSSNIAGDGATTSIVLSKAILSEGMKNISAGATPMSIKRGIDKAVQKVVEELNRIAVPVSNSEEIRQIAEVSADNDPETGRLVMEAMEKVGGDGLVSVADGRGIETELEIVRGLQCDKGFLSPYFITNGKEMCAELSDSFVLVVDKKSVGVKEFVSFLKKFKEDSQGHPLLVISDGIEGDVLQLLVLNKLKGNLSLCAISSPSFGEQRKEQLKDIAVLTGGKVISEDLGLSLEKADLSVLGQVDRIKVFKNKTVVVGGKGRQEEVEKRILRLRKEKEEATSDYEKKSLEKRLAYLSGGVALIHVGAHTECEMKKKKERFENAIHATQAAVKGGIVPGGGVALLQTSRSLDPLELVDEGERVGVNIVRSALRYPAMTIADNCGEEGSLIVEKIVRQKEKWWGFDGLTGRLVNLLEEGIVDPMLVPKSALQNAASAVGALLTVACMVTEGPKKEKGNTAPYSYDMMNEMGGAMGG